MESNENITNIYDKNNINLIKLYDEILQNNSVFDLLKILEHSSFPDDETLIKVLQFLINSYPHINYELLLDISDDFKTKYNPDHIRSLFRKYNIKGLDLTKEMEIVKSQNIIDHLIIKLFFKGK